MVDDYIKGDILIIETKDKFTINGFVYEKSSDKITIVHNFKNTKPIDKTIININNIEKVQKIEPLELN